MKTIIYGNITFHTGVAEIHSIQGIKRGDADDANQLYDYGHDVLVIEDYEGDINMRAKDESE